MIVISLAEKHRQQNDAMIEMLEDVLKLARAGTILDLGICYVTDDKAHFSLAQYESRIRLLGSIAFLNHDLLSKS